MGCSSVGEDEDGSRVRAALVVASVIVIGLTALISLAAAIMDGRILSEETACELGSGTWNDSNGSCAMPEEPNTVPDCPEVEAPGPTWLWCPFPLGLIAGIAGLIAIVEAVVARLSPVVEEKEDGDG